MNQPSPSDALALARHAAVTWIQEALKENYTLARATALASERTWGEKSYSASTLESWYYAYQLRGFAALHRQPRKDKGTRKALSPEACQALLDLRREHPALSIQVLVRQLVEKGVLQLGTFSMPSVYRFLVAQQMDAHSMRHNPPSPQSGPTKAFECPLANELWMTDLMFGPSLKLASGRVVHTRLFALLDDCSRLIPHAQYYDSEKLWCFLDCLRQGLARRGFPEKLYTDQGKIFTSYHLQIVCANLKVRLCHAKPYAAWSKAKVSFCTSWLRFRMDVGRFQLGPLFDLFDHGWRGAFVHVLMLVVQWKSFEHPALTPIVYQRGASSDNLGNRVRAKQASFLEPLLTGLDFAVSA
jgi:putative transposase